MPWKLNFPVCVPGSSSLLAKDTCDDVVVEYTRADGSQFLDGPKLLGMKTLRWLN